MHEDILKKLEQRIDRRSFLRGSGIAAAAVVGAAALPLSAHAQTPAPPDKKDDKTEPKKDDKKDEKSESKDDKAGQKDDGKTTKNEASDPFKETKKDEQGRDYRMCPQCGYNMYKQDRTWTCENCGYSYAE